MTFEQSMVRIEQIIAELSDKNTSLERSLELFSEGAELVCQCQTTLSNARGVIDTLVAKRREALKDAEL